MDTEDLIDEMLLEIFARVPGHEDGCIRVILGRVCRRWRRLAHTRTASILLLGPRPPFPQCTSWRRFATQPHTSSIAMLTWCAELGLLGDGDTTRSLAAAGWVECLQAMCGDGCPRSLRFGLCALAARNGHLGMLQWARANGCPWDEVTCRRAARNGDLKMLQWARANGCPWDKWVIIGASENGHLDVVQWAQANGCPESGQWLILHH
jgi:hypothetical protein